MKVCSIEGCTRRLKTRGLCGTHYERLRKHGSTENPRPTLEQRFWSKVDQTHDCWEWTGARNPATGYGDFHTFGESGHDTAHRVSWQLANGDIGPGIQIDHLCHNRGCVNPKHLRAVTPKQNVENHNGARATSASGIRGVWRRDYGAWSAQVKHNGRVVFNGAFATAAEAEAAVVRARNGIHSHNDRDRHVAS